MNIYVLCTIFAGILWGIISIFLKTLNAAGLTSIQVLCLRSLISAVLMFMFLFFKNKSFLKIKLKDIWMFIGTGLISLSFFSICYFRTIINCGAAIAVILLYTSPIFVTIFSFFFFHEKFSLKKGLSLFLTFIGSISVSGFLQSSPAITPINFLIGLCAGFGYALYSIFSRIALKKYNSLTITFYTFCFSSLGLIPFSSMGKVNQLLSLKICIFSLGIALICTVIPYILYTFGLSGLETSKAAILVTIEPFVGTLIGIIVFNEEMNLQKILGTTMILTAVLLLSNNNKK